MPSSPHVRTSPRSAMDPPGVRRYCLSLMTDRAAPKKSIVTRTIGAVALATALIVSAVGCGAPKQLSEEALITEASELFEQENYVQAIEHYSELLEQHPFSDHAEVASMNVAHAFYLSEQYENAIAAFNDFERLYPVSPLLPFVEYTVGLCHLDRSLGGDLDKSSSENARRLFERLVQRHPQSIFADLGAFRMAECDENLASHELYVGDYYMVRDNYDAAERRYQDLLDRYPGSDSAAEASSRLEELADSDRP